MIDRKEKQGSIVPVNKNVLVKFVSVEENKTKAGIILPEESLNKNIYFKGDKVYKVEVLQKSDDCAEHTPSNGFAIVNQLSGFGIPTVEEGYVKIVPETELLMKSNDKDFKIGNILPQMGRALVKVTTQEEKTAGGIIAPKGANTNMNWSSATLGGEIISVSPDWECDYVVGDTIRFDAYMGTDISIDGEIYRLVIGNLVLCKIVD